MLDFRGKTKDYTRQVMKRLWLHQAVFALIVFLCGFFLLPAAGNVALLVGVVWGLLDDAFIFGSTVRGFGMEPNASRRLLTKVFLYRLVTGISIIVVMLGLRLRVLETFIGFILLHIFLIINLKYFTSLRN